MYVFGYFLIDFSVYYKGTSSLFLYFYYSSRSLTTSYLRPY